MAEVYATGLLTRVLDPGNRHKYERGPGSGTLANPVSNQKHKVLCRAIGQGITQARGQSSEESEFMSDCFHAAGFYWKNFQLHPAAYNSPRIKLL